MQTEKFSQKINASDKGYLVFSTIVLTLLSLVLPFSILIIFDRVLPNQSKDTLYLLFVIILIAVWLDYFLKNQEEKLVSSIMKTFDVNLTNHVFQAVCFAEIKKFKQLETGEYLERIASIPEIKAFFGGESVRAVINLGVSMITILIIGIINIWAGLTLILASLLLVGFALKISKQKVDNLSVKSDIEGETTSKMIEIVSSPLNIKARNMEYRLENLMTKMVEEREQESIEYEQVESHFNLMVSFIQQLSVTVVVVILASSVINLQSSQGVMAAIIMLTNRYFTPYQQVMRTLTRWKLNKIYIQRMGDILQLQQTINNVESLKQEMHIEVQFLFAGSNPKIKRRNIPRIQFHHGQTYLLSGNSGSGKTHLVQCIAGSNKDSTICILINGKNIEDLYLDGWRQQVLIVNKNQTFVEGTIIDNLSCFSPKFNNMAFALCEMLGIKEHIDNLPFGFYSELKGHLSHPFSRQINYALFIVRALLTDKPVIIFDDIDEILDDDFSQRVLNCINYRNMNRIFIIVSNKIKPERLKNINLTVFLESQRSKHNTDDGQMVLSKECL